MKEDIDINEEIKISCPGAMEIIKTKNRYRFFWNFMLSPDNREVAVDIAGYTAKKYLQKSRVAPILKCILRVP